MDQFNDIIKLFMSAHEKGQTLLIDEDQAADSKWYDQFDEKVFSFKYEMVIRLKEAELNYEKVKSRMSCKSRSSKSSSKSGNSSSSKVSIEERAIEMNIRFTGVIAEANYADQKMKMVRNQRKGGKSKSKSKSIEYFW